MCTTGFISAFKPMMEEGRKLKIVGAQDDTQYTRLNKLTVVS